MRQYHRQDATVSPEDATVSPEHTHNFKVISNNGTESGYSNQCMWISIKDYINRELLIKDKPRYSLEEIRNIASDNNTIPINGPNFSFNEFLHYDAIKNITEYFNLKIVIHQYSLENGIGKEQIKIYGVGKNIVPIISYGNHFNLITEIDTIPTLVKHTTGSQYTAQDL